MRGFLQKGSHPQCCAFIIRGVLVPEMCLMEEWTDTGVCRWGSFLVRYVGSTIGIMLIFPRYVDYQDALCLLTCLLVY